MKHSILKNSVDMMSRSRLPSKFLFILVLGALLSAPGLVSAVYYCPGVDSGVDFECSLGLPDFGVLTSDPLTIFLWIFYAVTSIIGVLALVMIVVGGVQYVSSAGNSGLQSSAKKRIQNALLGLLLVLASTVILWTINPALTELRFPGIDDYDIHDDSYTARMAEYCSCAASSSDPVECQTAGYLVPDPGTITCSSAPGVGDYQFCGGSTPGDACSGTTGIEGVKVGAFTGTCRLSSAVSDGGRHGGTQYSCVCAVHDIDWCI